MDWVPLEQDMDFVAGFFEHDNERVFAISTGDFLD
jgi:hypothetical protein